MSGDEAGEPAAAPQEQEEAPEEVENADEGDPAPADEQHQPAEELAAEGKATPDEAPISGAQPETDAADAPPEEGGAQQQSVQPQDEHAQPMTTIEPQDQALAVATDNAASPLDNGQVASPRAEGVNDSNAIQVKFLVLPEGFSHVGTYARDIPAVYMYSQLEKDLFIDKHHFHISWEGHPFQETDILNEIATIPDDGPLILHLRFDALPSHLRTLSIGEITPGCKNVTVSYGDGIPNQSVIVTVVIAYDRKPFIGGFRHKNTGALFHHAVSQTDPVEKETKLVSDKVSRETQTQGKTRTVQTVRECATQMAGPGLLVNTANDFVVTSRPYCTSQQLHTLRVSSAVVIQSHTRSWFARKAARRLRGEKEEVATEMAKTDDQRRREHEEKRQHEIDRRTHPRTQKDFTTLYNELEMWRFLETRKIKESDMSKEEKQLALQELLKKETKLLQTIHKLQNAAAKENKENRITGFLQSMTAFRKMGTTGINVETPFTVRAKELMDLYSGLQLTGLNIDERLDILLHVKWTVKEFSCPLTRSIVELVDREADILNRGRPVKTLEGQRQQLHNLFLQFIETPEFNPSALNHQTVPLEYAVRPLVKLDNKR